MTITIMKPDEVRQFSNCTAYVHARIVPLLIWLIFFGGAVAVMADDWPHFHSFKIFAIVALLFLFLFKRFIIAPFQPSNWLVRTADNGMYVQFRSYLNYRWPTQGATVAFIPYSDIDSARLVHERLTVPRSDGRNGTATEFHRYVELELNAGTESLSAALETERNYSPPDNMTVYRDYPVTLKVPPFLRIEWKVWPGAKAFLKRLPSHISIQEPARFHEDFSNARDLDVEQQNQRIRELDRRGKRIEAVYLARQVRRCSLAEATNYVQQLAKQ